MRSMKTAIDGIVWRADADTLEFSYVDGAASEILGYSPEHWLAQEGFWQSKLHPEDANDIVSACVDVRRQGKSRRLTYRMIASDGRTVWLQDNIKLVFDGDRAVLSGIMVDVTELAEQRHRLELASRENAHYRKLYDLVPVAIWEEDWTGVLGALRALQAQGVDDIHAHAHENPAFVSSMLSQLEVLAVNAAAVEMFGASSARELIERATEVFEAENPGSLFLTALEAILGGKRTIEGVNRLRRLDGGALDVQVRIALPALDDRDGRVVICEMDITDSKATAERFELVTRATSDVIWDFDIVRDTMWASEGLQRIFGLNPKDLESSLSKWTERIHPDDLGGVMRQFEAIQHEGSNTWKEEYRFRKGDASYAFVRDEGFILRDATGAAVRMVGSLVDLTEQRMLEERFQHARKLEAIGKLTGGMAHDFNNLLTVIMGSLEAIEDLVGEDVATQNHVETAIHAVERSAYLINQLLSYARQRPMAPTTINMAHEVSQMCRVMSRTLGEHLRVSIRSEPDLWMCRADPGQFESALLNLCRNARDAMPDGGTLTVRMFNAEVGSVSPLAKRGLTPGRYAVLSVADTGHGMDEKTLNAAFEPFFTTKDVGAGSGLGLSMVQGFAQQSNGIVDIQSTPCKGTVVEIYLPAPAEFQIDSQTKVAPPVDRQRGSGNILLVEDQDMVRAHLTSMLEHLGYSVTSRISVPDAIKVLNSNTEIDLVLTDIILPGGETGLDLSRRASELRPGLPVAFISGYSDPLENNSVMLEEGNNFIRKPFRRNDLASLLNRMLYRVD